MGKRFSYRVAVEKTKYTSKMSKSKHDKHWPRKGAKRVAGFDAMMRESARLHEIAMLPDLAALQEAIDPSFSGPRPVTFTGFGGACPTQAYGTVDTGENWYFRFRHDAADLRIYGEGEGDLLRPRLNAGTYPLTDTGDAGCLGFREGMALIALMWAHLAPPTREYLDPAEFRGVLDPETLVKYVRSAEEEAELAAYLSGGETSESAAL
jgi:hypothetical protein